MRSIICRGLAAIAVLVSAASAHATNALPSADLSDVKMLNGVWKVVFVESEGQTISEDSLTEFVIEIQDQRIWCRDEGTESVLFVLDETSPQKRIDFFADDDGPMHGIYSLRGNELTICMAGNANEPAPTEFRANPDRSEVLVVLRRAK